jgi:HD-GYP domain-containing protein (c-di-GMP phosphodiesterase class II)
VDPSVRFLTHRIQKLTSVLEVTKAMAAERDLDSLLARILSEAAKVIEADRCSLFLLDRERQELWTKIAHGAEEEIRLPLGNGIAGTVGKTGEVINIPDAYREQRFNRSFDEATGYRTRSILCVPMRDAAGEITGVIEGINKREGTFTSEDEELLLAIGGQAAVAIEKALLYDEISRLFEGFVSASVAAIESRDPTTAGHSGRVAALTTRLAQSLERAGAPGYREVRFSSQDLQEIRYASMLHDFGKVGVREAVLVKAEKLYPWELELLRARFALVRRDLELESYRRRYQFAQSAAGKSLTSFNAEEDAQLARSFEELDQAFEFILRCNRPAVIPDRGFDSLNELSRITYRDQRNQTQPLLLPNEIEALSIPRGSLSAAERREIESHVTHTFRFLSLIPWSRSLRRVPEIAYAHHERLNGTGYPRAIPREQIPLQSKMMAVADIYDALTAADRPYKKAVPHAMALDILWQEAASGQVDRDLLSVFVDAEVPRLALGKVNR